VTVEHRGGAVAVAVTNEGRGLDLQNVPHLFERFQRAPDGRLAGVRGIGLGLHIARELVEAHGGHLAVESEPGGATTFRFTLPLG
jgi:signal transduction histidine kinase